MNTKYLRRFCTSAGPMLVMMTGPVFAGNSVKIKLLEGPTYEVEGYTMGARELEGYFGAIKEDDGVTEVVLVGADVGGDEGEVLFAKAAQRAGLKAMRKEDGETRAL